MKIKNQAITLATATLALSMSASSFAAFELMTNGDFEDGLSGWGTFADGDGGSSATHSATGGNGGGYGIASAANGGWGAGFVQTTIVGGAENPLNIADYGYAAGDTMSFTFDMYASNGTAGETGIKVESWAGGAFIGGSDVQTDIDGTTDWANYSGSYTLAAGADAFKVVLVGTNTGGITGFDNLMIDNLNASAVPVPAAAWLFGSALAGLVAVRRNK